MHLSIRRQTLVLYADIGKNGFHGLLNVIQVNENRKVKNLKFEKDHLLN